MTTTTAITADDLGGDLLREYEEKCTFLLARAIEVNEDRDLTTSHAAKLLEAARTFIHVYQRTLLGLHSSMMTGRAVTQYAEDVIGDEARAEVALGWIREFVHCYADGITPDEVAEDLRAQAHRNVRALATRGQSSSPSTNLANTARLAAWTEAL